jgi:uncharacterized protein YdhG (YjbR/CyaY superfamily)
MAETKSTKSGFTPEERAAMKARAQEAKAEQTREAGLKAVREAFAAMTPDEKSMAERIHDIVAQTAPHLVPKTFYGMPGFAREGGKMVCFFQPASKFGVRYSTFGFDQGANLDDSDGMWPTAYGLTKLTASDEKKIADLVKKAATEPK